jgi:hypothetical protein
LQANDALDAPLDLEEGGDLLPGDHFAEDRHIHEPRMVDRIIARAAVA